MEALLQESAHSDMTLYKVALLLPGQPTGQHTPPAGASAVPAGGTSTIQATSSITGYSSQHASLESNAADSPAASTATAGPPPTAVAAAQHSRMQDMLLTVHAEQELAGQVFLVVTTQLIRAGGHQLGGHVNSLQAGRGSLRGGLSLAPRVRCSVELSACRLDTAQLCKRPGHGIMCSVDSCR
jgi:hypothetical protein